MLTASEARATAALLTPTDFSLHKHIEVRIWDSIQHGGTFIIYAGEITENVITALQALGYKVMRIDDSTVRISWEK